ncbi:MAG: response regulator transcription factor [Candidatus Sericytochromatia bacterium]|nr:response regulator transcription factor [Candidatus Sericytochromatia bacterium]
MPNELLRIGIIEDNELLLSNYSDYFECQENYILSFAFESITALKKQIKKNDVSIPDIILLDINLPDISGIEAIPILKIYFQKTIIVMLTAFNDSENIIKSIQNGASGYLIKGMPLHEISLALENYKKDGSATSPYVAKKMLEYINIIYKNKETLLQDLTHREKEVVEHITDGLTNIAISQKLGIKASTINQHLKNIYIKIGVKSRTELISKILKY